MNATFIVFSAGLVIGFLCGVIGVLAADELICRRELRVRGRNL